MSAYRKAIVCCLAGVLSSGIQANSGHMYPVGGHVLSKTESASKMLFNDGWEFSRNDVSGEKSRITLPHTPCIEPLLVNDQWQGECIYQKTFSVPSSDKGKKLFLKFEAAMNEANVWVNGVKVASHLGGYLPFVVDITDRVQYGKDNHIKVELDNRDNSITGPKPLKKLDFNTYGGIYRDVWLIRKQPVYITDSSHEDVVAGGGIFFHTEDVTARSARLFTDTHLRNSSEQTVTVKAVHTLYSGKNRKILSYEAPSHRLNAGEATTLRAEGLLKNPELWSPAAPALYHLTTEVYADGKLTDTETVRVGVRDIRVTNEGCRVNGEKHFLRGVNRHQEYPYVGYAVSNPAQYRDAWLIKQGGFDYVRCSHYPPSPAFLDACDELGILVLDAILGWQYFGDKAFADHALESSRQLIRRDRNHPCILGWELSINESPMPKDFMRQAHQVAREEYPYPNCYSAGWINQTYDIYIQARQHRRGADTTRPLIVSEYGDWEYYAQNAGFNQDQWGDLKEEERSSRQPRGAGEKRLLQQARNVQEAHNDNLSTHAFADGYWAMFDYNRGYSNDLEHSGVMDIFRLPKYSYYFFRSQRSPKDMYTLYIASEWTPEVSKEVRIFSNCDEVELRVDGVTVGRQKADTDAFSSRLAYPPFTFKVACTSPGKVEAIGYQSGRKVAKETCATAAQPALLELTWNEAGKPATAGCNDVLFVYATLKDAAQATVTSLVQDVQFTVESGDAEIIGTASPQTEAGIAAILVRIGHGKSPVKITAASRSVRAKPLIITPI